MFFGPNKGWPGLFFFGFNFFTASQSRVRLDRDGLPSETLKNESLVRGESVGGSERTVLRVSAPWLIAQMCRFKFSPERPPRSWG